MSWKQVKSFNLSKMGTRKGWCLMNARLGFGIATGRFASAKADMESQRKNGTLHQGNPPAGVSVPVYLDTSSPYEHVVVCSNGNYYSDHSACRRICGYSGFIYPENHCAH